MAQEGATPGVRGQIATGFQSYRFFRLLALVLLLLSPCTTLAGESAGADPENRLLQAKAARLIADDWDVVYLQNARAGYGRTRVIELVRAGETVRQTDSSMRLRMRRLGEPIEIQITIQTTEDSEGRLLDFRTEMKLGPSPIISSGRVIDGTLEIATRAGQRTTTTELHWTDKDRGFFYAEQGLREKPMQPGEKRSFTALMPVFNQVARTRLIAGEYEQTQLLEGPKKLLRITSRTEHSGAVIDSTLWTDETGNVLKTQEAALDQTVYRATKAIALAGSEGAVPDLIVGTVVPLGGEIKDPHSARRVRYRVRLERADPQRIFPNSAVQKVVSKGNREIELSVSRSGQQDQAAARDRPTEADRTPSRLIQSDDERVVALAGKVAPAAEDPGQIAKALERYVYELIDKKDFSTALGSAAEVARSRAGDCTEHAVLLAGLARARGLASRVVVGLVYVPALGGFGYHMWTEVWVQDHWLPLDATRATSGTGSGHLKIAHASLRDSDGLTVFLPVLQVMGQIQLKLVEEIHD